MRVPPIGAGVGGAAGGLFGVVVLVGAVLVGVGSPLAGSAGAATRCCAASNTTVMSNADTGTGSLRTAITNANTNSGAEVICIDTTLVTVPIVLSSNLPAYTHASDPLTIDGNGATLNGNGHDAIVSTSTGLVTIDSLTVTGVSVTGDGGGVSAVGPATLTNSTISNNTASLNSGGVGSNGAVTLTNSTVSGNTARERWRRRHRGRAGW